jgi:hypothetical protein
MGGRNNIQDHRPLASRAVSTLELLREFERSNDILEKSVPPTYDDD